MRRLDGKLDIDYEVDMSTAYLEWIDDLLEEAQVPLGPETAGYIDTCLREIAGVGNADAEAVYRALHQGWLRHGESGRQLLAALLRGQVFSRRDSPLRPQEGVGYYVNPGQEDPT